MRAFGALNPRDLIPVPPDTVGSVSVTSAGAVVALDFPTGATIVCFGSETNFWCDMESTSVAIPAVSSAGTTATRSEYLRDGTFYQIPGASTGFSITAATSGVISTSFWSKH